MPVGLLVPLSKEPLALYKAMSSASQTLDQKTVRRRSTNSSLIWAYNVTATNIKANNIINNIKMNNIIINNNQD